MQMEWLSLLRDHINKEQLLHTTWTVVEVEALDHVQFNAGLQDQRDLDCWSLFANWSLQDSWNGYNSSLIPVNLLLHHHSSFLQPWDLPTVIQGLQEHVSINTEIVWLQTFYLFLCIPNLVEELPYQHNNVFEDVWYSKALIQQQ